MPDWSYQTLLKPLLFRLPHDTSRRFVVSCFESMSAIPGGERVVDALGHMRPDRSIGLEVAGLQLSSPVGLAPVVDPEGRARRVLSRFGVGWLTIGPVATAAPAQPTRFRRTRNGAGIVRHGRVCLSLSEALCLDQRGTGGTRLAIELQPEGTDDGRRLIEELAPLADAYLLSPTAGGEAGSGWRDELAAWAATAEKVGRPLFLGVPNDGTLTGAVAEGILDSGIAGIYLSGKELAGEPESWCWHEEDLTEAIETLRSIEDVRSGLAVIVDGGIVSPRNALCLLEAGADLVSVGVGLVHTGPGLPKRINEAIEYHLSPEDPKVEPAEARPAERRAWFWGAALGLAMGIGALLAVVISLTEVLLPYDESFLGQSRSALESFNPRILQFMSHDRITLAGTMVSLSVIYISLSLFGMRKGHHWAQRALTVSAAIGFGTFFSFLAFGYLDPFHAFVSAILFQLFIQTVVQPIGTSERDLGAPHLDNDRVWRFAQWGQLVFVLQAIGLLAGGATILTVGMTGVFVDTDLGFLGMTSEDLRTFDDQLIPLIAHDRATFGGMLLAGGTVLLLTTLWSHRAGDRWLWWTYLVVILPPYAMTLWIHREIGYTNLLHLSPVFLGLLLMVVGLILSGPWLLRRGNQQID